MIRHSVIPGLDVDPPALRQVTLRVLERGGINLGQGTCLLKLPDVVKQAAHQAINDGHNHYSAASGINELREALHKRLIERNKIPCGKQNVVITNGSTGAFEAICSTFLQPEDEVIIFKPFYPYHHSLLRRHGIQIKYVPLDTPDWSINFEKLEQAFTDKTKFVLVCTPNNPTGKVFSRGELEKIAALCKKHDSLCVTDEVYEYITYDGSEHISMASLHEMFERTLTMGSYSKTFAITGWRIGYLVAPDSVLQELVTSCDQKYVCAPTPFQFGVAAGIRECGDTYFLEMLNRYEQKREILLNALNKAELPTSAPQGAYYLIADIRQRFPGLSSEEAVDVLIDRAGVGAVPASDFLGPEVKGDPMRSTFLRFCFAVPDPVLEHAANSLQEF